MMKYLVLITIALILMVPLVMAHEEKVEAGITPDSIFWGLDKAFEQISFLLTTSPEKEALKGLEIANERLSEIKIMIEENKLEDADKARKHHEKILLKVEKRIEEIEEVDAIEEIREVIEIEKEMEEHEQEIEDAHEELKIKIKIKGEMTQEQRDFVDSILNNLDDEIRKVEIEIESKKGKIKIKIERETEEDGDEIEDEIEDEIGLSNFKSERAEEMKRKALNKWDDVLEKAEEYNVSVPSKSDFDSLISSGDGLLALGNNEEAKDIYEEAKDLAEDLKHDIEDANGDKDEEDELEIEVKIKDGLAEVDIEFGDDELEFVLETTNREEIIAEIAERTGLTIEEVEAIIEFEIDDDDEADNDEDDEEDNDDDNNDTEQNNSGNSS